MGKIKKRNHQLRTKFGCKCRQSGRYCINPSTRNERYEILLKTICRHHLAPSSHLSMEWKSIKSTSIRAPSPINAAYSQYELNLHREWINQAKYEWNSPQYDLSVAS